MQSGLPLDTLKNASSSASAEAYQTPFVTSKQHLQPRQPRPLIHAASFGVRNYRKGILREHGGMEISTRIKRAQTSLTAYSFGVKLQTGEGTIYSYKLPSKIGSTYRSL